MLYEIRDYHYRADLFEPYKKWAEELAVPVLKEKLDVVGFWISNGEAPEVAGTDPIESSIGYANVTWIIRWDNKAARDKGLPAALESDEWKAVWAKHPDQDGYQQILARFMEAI